MVSVLFPVLIMVMVSMFVWCKLLQHCLHLTAEEGKLKRFSVIVCKSLPMLAKDRSQGETVMCKWDFQLMIDDLLPGNLNNCFKAKRATV